MTIKPRKNDNASLEAAKGLARWDWIKKYLAPAMKYIGISGDQFDRLFIGKDQILNNRVSGSEWALPKISVGTTYTPSGVVYGPANPVTGERPIISVGGDNPARDGYLYIEYDVAFTNKIIIPGFEPELIISPSPYQFTRDALVMVDPPKYKFYLTQQSNYFSATVGQNGIGQGDTSTIKTLIGARINSIINTFGYTDDTTVMVNFSGAQFINFWTS
jgi:hypothetical protein